MLVVLSCRRASGFRREAGADRAEVSRGRSTGRDQVRGREGPNVRWETEESVLLVLVAVIAAIPPRRASCREETASSVEYRS